MLIIDTFVAPSKISGLGIYANEDIKEGDVLWILNSTFDNAITGEELEKLPEFAQIYARTYIYWSKYKNAYILCGDNAKHFNHTRDEVNTKSAFFDSAEEARAYYNSHCPHQLTEEQLNRFDFGESFTIATKAIKKGEELVCNYSDDFPDEGPAKLYADAEWI